MLYKYRGHMNINGLMIASGLMKRIVNEQISFSSKIHTQMQGVNMGSMRLSRKPVRVYVPGEKVPSNKERRVQTQENENDVKMQTKVDSAQLFKNIMSETLKATKRGRKKLILEGTKLVEEGFRAGLKLDKLFLSKSLKEIPEVLDQMIQDASDVHKVTEKNMQTWSSLTTPPGVIGIFFKPTLNAKISKENLTDDLPLNVVLDNVREPGNLGSILRTAAAVSCKQIILSKGCCDPWDVKSLRGGSGAHFRIPIIEDVETHLIGNYLDLEQIPSDGPGAVIFITDTKEGIPYTDAKYDYESVTLILGSEARGVSHDILELIKNLDKIYPEKVKVEKIKIPLKNDIESLNVANAFGIIAFEILRQYQQKHRPTTLTNT